MNDTFYQSEEGIKPQGFSSRSNVSDTSVAINNHTAMKE